MVNAINDRFDPTTTVVDSLDAFGMAPDPTRKAIKSLAQASQRTATQTRRDGAADTEAVWNNCFEPLVINAMKQRYDEDLFNDLRISVNTVSKRSNVLRDVVGKMATAWEAGSTQWLALREGTDMSGLTPEDRAGLLLDEETRAIVSPEFDAWRASFGGGGDDVALAVDNWMKAVDALVLRHPRIAVVPSFPYDPETKKRRLTHTVLTPAHFDLVPNLYAPSQHVAFVHYFDGKDMRGETVALRRVWTTETIRTEQLIDANTNRWQYVEGSARPNGYGVLPCVLFSASQPVLSCWPDCHGEMLREVTIETNIALTYLSLLMLNQHKQIGGEFKPGAWADGQQMAPGRVIMAALGVQTLQVFDFQTDVTRFRQEFIRAPLREAAVTCGLSPDEFDVPFGLESGEAKKMRYHQRDRASLSRRQNLRAALGQLFWLSARLIWFELRASGAPPILGFERGLTLPYVHNADPQPVVFGVDVNDITYPELAMEREARERRDLEIRQTNLVELYRAKNPEIVDDAMAMAQMENNDRINRKFGAVGVRAAVLPTATLRPAQPIGGTP